MTMLACVGFGEVQEISIDYFTFFFGEYPFMKTEEAKKFTKHS